MELAGRRGDGAEGEEQVQLGMPGAWAVHRAEVSDHCTSKIGGRPDWPFSGPGDDLLKCAVCGGLLSLVAQVHAPLALPLRNLLSERTLYVLGCAAPRCGANSSCWRVIRIQKEAEEQQQRMEQPNLPPMDCSSSTVVGGDPDPPTGPVAGPPTDWWDGDETWGDEGLDGKSSSGQQTKQSMDMQDLASSLMEAGRVAAEAPSKESSVSHRKAKDETVRKDVFVDGQELHGIRAGEVHNLNLPLPTLPCFYIYFKAESYTRGRSTALALPSALPADVVQTTAVRAVPEAEAWEGEEYEPDKALHADGTYLRFKKQLDHDPEQCLRYCFGGQVLWAVEEGREAPRKCSACGGPQVYEMQLMPPLVYFLHGGAACDGSDRSPCSPDEWCWLTLAVFTCAQSCSYPRSGDIGTKHAGWTIIEETVVLQQETNGFAKFTDLVLEDLERLSA